MFLDVSGDECVIAYQILQYIDLLNWFTMPVYETSHVWEIYCMHHIWYNNFILLTAVATNLPPLTGYYCTQCITQLIYHIHFM